MSSTSHVVLSTGTAYAKLFFCGVHQDVEFRESNYERRRRFRPSFIIYQETLYTHSGMRVSESQLQGHFFSKGEILTPQEFDCLFWMILDENEAFEKEKENASRQISQKADHIFDGMSYYLGYHCLPPVSGLEKRLIDNLNIPGLESALREAVRRENYEAAAYIRDRIQAEGYIIFEDNNQLKVRLPKRAALH